MYMDVGTHHFPYLQVVGCIANSRYSAISQSIPTTRLRMTSRTPPHQMGRVSQNTWLHTIHMPARYPPTGSPAAKQQTDRPNANYIPKRGDLVGINRRGGKRELSKRGVLGSERSSTDRKPRTMRNIRSICVEVSRRAEGVRAFLLMLGWTGLGGG